MKNSWIWIFGLLTLVFGCGAPEEASAEEQLGTTEQALCSGATLQGTIKYVRNWATQDCNNASRVKCSDNGTLFGYGPVVISALPGNGGGAIFGATSSTGAYSICVPGGTTYQLRTHNRDADIGNGSAANYFGPASIGIVTSVSVAVPNGEIIDNISTPQNVNPNTVVTFNPVVTSGSVHDRATYYMLAMLQRDIWLGPYSTTLLQNGHYRLRMDSGTSGSSGTISCRASTTDCVMLAHINMAQSSLTLFHETGHGIQRLVQRMTPSIGINYSNYDAVNSCVTINGEFNAGSALIEGWAEFVQAITQWDPATVPPLFNGQICNGSGHPPSSGPQPNASACGTGAIAASRDNVVKGFMDLVDANTVVNPTGCRNEQLQLPVATVLTAWTKFSATTGKTGCALLGFEEGGANEGSACNNIATPNWPYTGTNALPPVDGLSYLDFLAILKTQFAVSGSALFDNWANSGWARGDSATQLP